MSCSRTQHSNAGEARIRNPSVLSQAHYHWATALLWNGSGWYGFTGAILASMTDISPVVHLHAIGNIHMRVYFIGSRTSVGGKPNCSSRVREFHCDPTSPLFPGDWSSKQIIVHSPPSADSRKVLVSFM